MTELSDSPPDLSIDLYVKAALGKKAIDVIALDVRKLTSFTTGFLRRHIGQKLRILTHGS